MKKLAIDTVTAIARVLSDWDGSPEHAAEKLGAAVKVLSEYRPERPQDGVEAISRERTRQKEVEGWTPEHDDAHDGGELIKVAACYLDAALTAEIRSDAAQYHTWPPRRSINFWPSEWAEKWWKPSNDPIRNLEKSGALIAAEIDRLKRRAGK